MDEFPALMQCELDDFGQLVNSNLDESAYWNEVILAKFWLNCFLIDHPYLGQWATLQN